jgi:hypothetical protein
MIRRRKGAGNEKMKKEESEKMENEESRRSKPKDRRKLRIMKESRRNLGKRVCGVWEEEK